MTECRTYIIPSDTRILTIDCGKGLTVATPARTTTASFIATGTSTSPSSDPTECRTYIIPPDNRVMVVGCDGSIQVASTSGGSGSTGSPTTSTDWPNPGAIGSNTPNTGRFTQLSTGTIHLIEKQLRPQLREIIRTDGQITRVSIYSTPAKTTELYRKTLNYTSGTLTSITETDYTTNPPTTRTKTLTRSSGQITTVEVA